jgi:hypothetical protein
MLLRLSGNRVIKVGDVEVRTLLVNLKLPIFVDIEALPMSIEPVWSVKSDVVLDGVRWSNELF